MGKGRSGAKRRERQGESRRKGLRMRTQVKAGGRRGSGLKLIDTDFVLDLDDADFILG